MRNMWADTLPLFFLSSPRNIETNRYFRGKGKCADIRWRKQKKAGAINQVQFMEGIEAFTIGLFTRTLGWSAEEVQVFLERVRKDAVKKERHRQLNL